MGEGGAPRVEQPPVPEPPRGGGDQGGRPPGVEGAPEAPSAAPPEAGPRPGEPAPTVEPTAEPAGAPAAQGEPAKRPVTKNELDALEKRARTAQQVLNRAERDPSITPERLDTLRQRAEAAANEWRNAEGPPGRASYIGGTREEQAGRDARHQAALEEHAAAIDRRIYEEGGPAPAPDTKDAGKVFTQMGGGETRTVISKDSQGNTWIGTGHVMIKSDPSGRNPLARTANARAQKTKPYEVNPQGLDKVVTPDPKGDYQPVKWVRRVTDSEGRDLVLGQLPNGKWVALQKPVYDALHVAARQGQHGEVVAPTKGSDARFFARNYDNTGKPNYAAVGMPINVDQAKAAIWARGESAPATQRVAQDAYLADRAGGAGTRGTGPMEPLRPETDLFGKPVERPAGPGTTEEPGATPETSTLAEPLTTEPDHVVPNQYVAKDATGEVVGKGPTPEAALADARGEPGVESRVGRAKGFEGVPEVGRPKTIYNYKFNPGASPFRGVIAEMGEDPASFAQKGIDQQAVLLQKHVANKFGFNSVTVERSAGTGRPDARRAVDAMMNLSRALHDGMASMGLPLEAASNFGKLKLVFDPEGKVNYLGAYFPGKQEIRLQGGANSYGHEWIHAIDHAMAERFTGNPTQQNHLLSQYTRASGLNVSDNIQAAWAKLINTVFYDEGAFAVKRLQLETDALKTNAQGQPTVAAKTAQAQLERLDKGASRLAIQMSEFRKNSAAFEPKKAGYWASAWELLGRSGEAYMAAKMDEAGRDPRGFVMPNEAYLNTTDDVMKAIYPKDEDRVRIFKAWDEFFQAMHNEGVLNQGQSGTTFSDYGVSDPKYWNVSAPGLRQTPQGLALSRQLNASRSFYQRLYDAMPYDRSRPTPGEYTFKRVLADSFRGAAYSYRGNIETIINRAPKAAQPILQEGLNRLATQPGSGLLIHRTFEEAIRYGENLDQGLRAWMRRYAAALSQTALDPNNSTVEEQQMLRHYLTTGEKTYPIDPLDPSAGVKQMPANIAPAAEQVRQLLNDVWHAMQDAKIDVGYAKSGFFPRLYDLQKIFANTVGFKKAAAHTYKFTFDQDVGTPGDNPGNLVEQWMGLSREERQNADPAVQGQMQQLVKNLNRQAAIEENQRRQAELQANPNRTPQETAELAQLGAKAAAERTELGQLKKDAQALAQAAHDPVGNHVAETGASEWLGRLLSGGAHDFTQTGMSGNYMKARKLPPEADLFMRDFMHTNPFDAIPHYLNSAARKIAIVERFGNNTADGTPQELARIIKQAGEAGVRGEDLQDYKRYMNMVLGRDNTDGAKPLQRLTTLAHAGGSIVLMPRAMWSSLAEPMNANLVTGKSGAGFRIIASQIGQLMDYVRSRPSEITELAHFLNVTTSPMMDSIILSRMGADYADRPALNRLLSWYYRVTGLTQLTNSQRIGAVASANWFLGRLARDFKGTNATDREGAQRWFRELGMSDRIHDKFAQFMLDQNGGRPSIDTLKSHEMGSAYGLAIGRIVDRVIQDPYKVDTPVGGSNPMTRLAFQLMHFNYSYQKNVLNPMWEGVTHSYGQAKLSAQQAGAGAVGARARGLVAAGGTMANTAAMAGTVLGAGLLVNMVRQSIFAPDQWKEHEDKGDLWEWLRDLTFQRSGFNGTLDPIIQVYSHLRYDADISSLMEGASINYMFKNMQDVIQPFVTANDSPNTNTLLYNQARGAFNLIGVPAAAIGLTMLGQAGGPFTRLASGAALQYGTSPYMSGRVAAAAAGDKGTKLPKEGEGLQGLRSTGALQELPSGEPDKSTGPGSSAPAATGGIGLLDDVAVPAWRYGQGVMSKVPGPLKALAAAGALGYAVNDYFGKTAPFREQSALNAEENQ